MSEFSNAPGPPLGNDNNIPNQQLPERERTAEEIAMIHAAMMEELGIGRMDSLPLSDRGPDPGSMGAHLPVKRNMKAATARWRDMKFNDVNPAEAELDSIADGQLYRLRRGVSTSSARRGRGNAAPRGGHSINRGRGGAFGRGGSGGESGHSPSRGGFTGKRSRGGSSGEGRISPSRGGYTGQRSGVSAYDTSSTPTNYYNNARRAMDTTERFESAIARLHPPPQPAEASVLTQQGNHLDKSRQKSRPSKPLNPLPVNSKFGASLASAKAFFAHAGVSLPGPVHIKPTQVSPGNAVASQPTPQPTPAREPSLPPGVEPAPQQSESSTPSATSRELMPRDETTVEVRLPRAPSPIIEKNGGLSGSRWAPPDVPGPHSTLATNPDPSPTVNPNALASLNSPSPSLAVSPNAAAFRGRILLREQSVKIKQNSGPFRLGTARLTKNDHNDVYVILELIDVATSHFLVNEMVYDNVQLEVDRTILTYRAAQQSEVKPPTWRINFLLPYEAVQFFNTIILSHRGRTNQFNTGLGASADARANSDSGPLPQLIYSASVDTASYSAPEHQEVKGIRQPTFDGRSGPGQLNQTFTDATSHLTQPLAQVSDSQHQEYLDINAVHESTSELFSQVADDENVDKLISFSDEEDESKQPSQMQPSRLELSQLELNINELLDVDDSEFIQGLFRDLEVGAPGSLLNQLSNNVVGKKGKPAQELTSEEMLSSDSYWLAATNVVGEKLSLSETFNMLPEELATAYALDKGRKVLELAVAQHGMISESRATDDEDEVAGVGNMNMSVDTTQTCQKDDAYAEPSSSILSGAQELSDAQQDVKSAAHVKYSPHHLLGLRNSAAPVDIIAQPPRARRPTLTVISPSMNVSGWKSFADQESEVNLQSESADPSRTLEQKIANQIPPILVQESSAAASETVSMASSAVSDFSQDTAVDTQKHSPVTPSPDQEPVVPAQKPLEASVVSKGPGTNVETGPAKGQITDTKLWEALFRTISSIGSPSPGNMTKAETNQVPSRGIIKHHPSNSDINDRLVKSLQGFHIDKNAEAPVVESPTVELEDPVAPSSLDSIGVPSIPESTAIRNIQTTPTLRQSHPVTSTPASTAMSAKISASLKVPFVASQVQSPVDSVGGQVPAVGAQSYPTRLEVNTETEAKFPEVNSLQVGSETVKVEHAKIYDTIRQVLPVQAVTVPEASTIAELPHSKPAVKTLPEQKVQQKTEQVPIPVTQTIEEERLAEISNKSLKGKPGLSASIWAKDSPTPQFKPRHHTPKTPIKTPAVQPYPHPQGSGFWPHAPPPQASLPTSMQSPLLTLPQFAPMYQTVLVRDPITGALIEVTGMVKTGSMPLTPQGPVPQMAPRQMYQENHPYGMATSAQASVSVSGFPTRNNTHGRHLSSESLGHNKTINAATPSRNPLVSSGTTGQRNPRSPAKVNLQTRLQSRLDKSMTSPRGSFQGPHY